MDSRPVSSERVAYPNWGKPAVLLLLTTQATPRRFGETPAEDRAVWPTETAVKKSTTATLPFVFTVQREVRLSFENHMPEIFEIFKVQAIELRPRVRVDNSLETSQKNNADNDEAKSLFVSLLNV